MTPLAIVVLAAGNSSRLGQNKQLITIQGQSLIARQCQQLLTLDVPVYCVLGFQAKQVAKALKSLPQVGLIENTQWQQGLGGSIALAANTLLTQCRQLLFVLGDQWQLTPAHIRLMIQASKNNPNDITVASNTNTHTNIERGNKKDHNIVSGLSPPVIFPQHLFHELCALQGKQGAKSILTRHTNQLTRCHLPEAFIDLDTVEQLEQLRQIHPN